MSCKFWLCSRCLEKLKKAKKSADEGWSKLLEQEKRFRNVLDKLEVKNFNQISNIKIKSFKFVL